MSPSTPPLRTYRDKALISLQCLWLALVRALLPAPGIRSLWQKLLAVLCLATLSLGASAQNRSYEFTTNDTVTLTNAASALSNRTTFTLEFWAKFTSVSGTINLVDFTGSADVGGLILNSGKLTVDLSCDFGCLTESDALSLSAGTWYHIAVVFDNGTWDFYVDGVARGTNVLDQGALTSVPDYAALTVTNLVFGLQNHSSVDDFVGSLDDIRLWSSARTPAQIQNNRSHELVGNEPGLLGYWKLNESSGTTVNDSQTNTSLLTGTSSGVGFSPTGAFVIAPTVVSVTSSSPNGTYKINGTIDIQVNFSEPVTVTGTPQLTLETGGTDRAVNYVSGSGLSTLNFQYTVQAGDSSADLDYATTTSLVLNSGTIRDAGNNNAILTLASPGAPNSLGGNKSLVIDGVMPAVTSTAPSGGALSTDTSVDFTVNFSESVVNLSTDDFALGVTGNATGTIASVSASSGSSVTVTVSGITGNGTLRLHLNGSTNIADAAGNSSPAAYTSGTAHTVAMPTAPGAPTIGTATAGDGQASVTFTAPVSNGGSAITTYTATANPGGATATGSSSPITVTGLTNGTAYTFTVTASNAIGTSVASGASNSATPKGNQTITFPNPGAQNFGTTPDLSSTASATSSLAPTFTSSTTGVCTITSGGALTFVTAGSCTIDADQAGNTTWNAATTVTQIFTVNAIVPGAPTIGTATAGDTQASVTFTAPASTGGAAIIASGYTVTANPGGATATGSSSPITVTGLTIGIAYTFTVTATNSAGEGLASADSNSVTPAAPQTITFTNPGSQNFGTTPTLTATSTAGGGYPVSFTSSTTGVCTITSGGALTFVTAGTCTINANQAGDSSFLAAPQVSQSFTVAAVAPGAPTAATATAGDTQASIVFTAPAFKGGANITGYTVTSSPAGGSGSCAALPATACTVTGLTNGVSYTFTVTATNSVGTGAASAASNAVTPLAIPINGVCASAQGVAVVAAPSVNLCSTGTASGVASAAATFTWDCAGSNGGTTAQCSAPRQYQVTASAGANGSITPAGVQTVAYNATPSFTITPAALYRIDSVSGCGGTLVGSTYTTGAVAANCTVSASFVLIAHAITVTAQPSAGGTVTCTPSTVGEGGSATCTAVANAGYVFQKWTGACAGQAAACNLTNVTAPPTSAALFRQEQTGLTIPEGAKQGEGLGLVLEPSVNNWVIQSASTATVASTGVSAPSGVQFPHGLVNLKLVTGTAGTSASVVLTYPQALPAGTKYYKFGKTTANPTTDHWYEFSGAAISGNTITLTLTDGALGDNDLTANSVIEDPGGPAVVKAPPPPPPPPPVPVKLQVSTSGPGTVQRSVAGSVVGMTGTTTTLEYPAGQSVTLTPAPQAGARFAGWMGACSGMLPCTLTLRTDQAVQATFAAATCRARAFSAEEERMLAAYLAYYGRPADAGGLAYWVASLAGQGGNMDATFAAFGRSQEFQQRFGHLAGEQLIANLYQQMYWRDPEPGGAAFYAEKLASGQCQSVNR